MKLLKITLLIVFMSLTWAKTNYKNPYLDSFTTKSNVQGYNLGNLKDKLKGNVLLSITWYDKLGKNIFVLTKTKKKFYKNKFGDLVKEQYIFAYHFLEKNGKLKRIRRLIDFEKECEFDLHVDFVKHALSITDINQDGIAEITMVYKKDCKSDVGPSSMKVIMLHNNKKYALRGVSDLKPDIKKSIDCYWCNKYKIDPAFKKAPKSFLIFAKERWNMFRY